MDVPGIVAQHAIITPNCRKVHGTEKALDVALARVRDEYLACAALDCNDEANYRVVLSIERPDPPAKESDGEESHAQG